MQRIGLVFGWCAVAVFAGLLGASESRAATLIVDGGQLVGATNVDVGGASYDVSFQDGTCIALFAGCDAASDFVFSTAADAQLASEALLEQVFTGAYDDSPELTAGCTSAEFCGAFTPYGPAVITTIVSSFMARNGATGSIFTDDVFDEPNLFAPDDDFSILINTVWVAWTPVPEPSTALLLFAGLVLMSLWRRAAPGLPGPPAAAEDHGAVQVDPIGV